MLNSESIPIEKIRSVLITRTAIKLLESESNVEKVVNFQFKDMLQMMKVHHQVEMSGFGKFMISGPKVQRRVDKLEQIVSSISSALQEPEKLGDKKETSYRKKLEDATIILEYLKTRKNGYEN